MQYKNIIFDLDGTLWDSRTTLIHSWNAILEKYNLLEKPLEEEDLNQFMGLLLPEILPIIFPNGNQEIWDQILEEILEHENRNLMEKGGILYNGAEETLKELKKNHALFIVSNCQEGYIETFLDYFGFEFLFVDFECFGRTGKPKVENIKLVLERNDLETSETVYVGDTQTDYLSATENHLDFIFCNYGFGNLYKTNNALKINELKELIYLV